MYDSNWSKFIEDRGGLLFAFLAAALFVIVIAWPAILAQREIQNDASRNAAYYSERAQKNVAAKCADLAGQARADCAQPIEDAAREAQRGEDDSAAQQTVAIWTAVMGGVAILGVALSGVGVFLVWTTFAETKRANIIALSDRRPWIDIKVVKLSIARNRTYAFENDMGVWVNETRHDPEAPVQMTVEFKFENTGKTHAQNLTFWSKRLKGQYQIMGEPSIYGPNLSDFYQDIREDRRKIEISALLPEDSTGLTAVILLNDDWLGEPMHPGDRNLPLPRYAIIARYEGIGIDGYAETGKTFSFIINEGGSPVDPRTFKDGDDWKTEGFPITSAIHLT